MAVTITPVDMFNVKPDVSYGAGPKGAAATVISLGVKVEGDFSSQTDVVVEGEVQGTFSTEGALTVGQEAKIKAEVKAGSAVVSGTVEGNMNVAKKLELRSTARITGDITAETIAVEPGATISGKFNIGAKAADYLSAVKRDKSGTNSKGIGL